MLTRPPVAACDLGTRDVELQVAERRESERGGQGASDGSEALRFGDVSESGVAALRADRDEVVAVARSLSSDEWGAASDCQGWRVQDVVTHMANVCRAVVDPGALAPGVPGDLEATQAAQAEAHRDWGWERVLADYEETSAKALDALAGLQAPGMAETVIPIENAGHYPLHLVANAMAFDHFCHLRNDILRPNGPIERPSPEADDLRVGASLEWLMAGLPQMTPALAGVLTKPLGLRLTGPGGGEWTVAPGDDGTLGVSEGASAETCIISTAPEFIVWSTGRRPWRERDVQLSGDRDYAARVLDVVRLF